MTKLYAPEEYWITPEETRRKIVNGCGTSGWKGQLVPNTLLGVSITSPCDIHDWMYWAGKADEASREEADRVFLNNMLRVVEVAPSNWLTRAIRRRMALHYYEAVRDFGAPHFWAGKNSINTFREE